MSNSKNAFELFATISRRRGWTQDFMLAAEDPRHDELLDCQALIDELEHIRSTGRTLVVHPDFDVDGITSGVIAMAGLAQVGLDVRLHLPDYNRGHDLSVDDVQEIVASFPDAYAILTTDTGISAHAGVEAAHAAGLKVFVTDHHLENHGRTAADLIVNPGRQDETYANKHICGAHVIYQIVHAYCEKYAPWRTTDIEMLRLFAGLGTVADMMPVLQENRRLVRESVNIARLFHTNPGEDGDLVDPDESAGMRMLTLNSTHHPMYTSAFRGMAVLLAALAQRGRLRSMSDLDESFYAWNISPALNSIRRIDGPMVDAFTLFLAHDVDAKQAAAQRILDNNELRKKKLLEYHEQMFQTPQPLAPWVWTSTAPRGMLGLLANKIMADRQMPVVVVHEDLTEQISGSARAPMWYDLNSAVNDAGFTAIGHEQACGVRVEDLDALRELAEFLEQDSQKVAEELQKRDDEALDVDTYDLVLGISQDADSRIDTDELVELCGLLNQMRPFGFSFPEPIVRVDVDLYLSALRKLGSESQHLSIRTPEGLKLLWWNVDPEVAEDLLTRGKLRHSDRRHVSFTGVLGASTFNGRTSPDLIVKEMLQEVPVTQESREDA